MAKNKNMRAQKRDTQPLARSRQREAERVSRARERDRSDDTETPPAAPAAPETGSEQAGAAEESAVSSPDPEGSAPPASADAEEIEVLTSGTSEAMGRSLVAALDQSQERLDAQAEEKQPQAPVFDRVMARLARCIDDPAVGYASTSPEVALPGELAELNAKLLGAMTAEGVTCARQGDTLKFLLEQLRESVRPAF